MPNSWQLRAQRVDLRLAIGSLIGALVRGRDVVVHRGDRQVGPPDLAAGQPQALERLRPGDLVDEVQVDVEQRGLALLLEDDVAVPDLLEQRLRHSSGYGAGRGCALVAAQGRARAARMSDDSCRAAGTAAPTMKLQPFYRLRFGYPEGGRVHSAIPTGRTRRTLPSPRVAPRRRRRSLPGLGPSAATGGRTFEPDFQAVIETDDGGALVEIRRYGRAYPPGRRPDRDRDHPPSRTTCDTSAQRCLMRRCGAIPGCR